jgi:hypothetical protein
MLYNFPLSFIEELETTTSVWIRRWMGIPPSASIDLAFVQRKNHGLQLHNIADFFRRMQLVRMHLLNRLRIRRSAKSTCDFSLLCGTSG